MYKLLLFTQLTYGGIFLFIYYTGNQHLLIKVTQKDKGRLQISMFTTESKNCLTQVSLVPLKY